VSRTSPPRELPHYGLGSIKTEEIYDGSSLIGGSHGDGTASASVIELLSLSLVAMTEPLSVKLVRHATGVIGVIIGTVNSRSAGGSEISQSRDALGPFAGARLP
jgi:hypothetical protein